MFYKIIYFYDFCEVFSVTASVVNKKKESQTYRIFKYQKLLRLNDAQEWFIDRDLRFKIYLTI